jgi:hypothetical protein
MLDLIRKRHEGPGWQVFTELWNGTGGRAKRRADAVAMGLWPSRGYEIHGYECKASRGDVRRELVEPSKADEVGKYCDYWWLVVEDPKMTDGLMLPLSWGLLAPRNRVLRIVTQAKKRPAEPIDRAFAAAMLRSVNGHWVPQAEHQKVLEERNQAINDAVQRERASGNDQAKRELEALRATVRTFEQASGIEIQHGWQNKEVGEAVRVLVDAQSMFQRLKHRIGALRNAAELETQNAKQCREAARALEGLLPQRETAD